MRAPESSQGTLALVALLRPTRRDGEVTCAMLERVGMRCRIYPDASALAVALSSEVDAILLTDAALLDPQIARVLTALDAQPSWSDIPVILLTQAEALTPASSNVVGEFANLTVLDRPTSSRALISAIQAALRGRDRQYLIRDHLRSLENAQATVRESADRLSLAVQVAGLALADFNTTTREYRLTAEAAQLFGIGTFPCSVPESMFLERVHAEDRHIFEPVSEEKLPAHDSPISAREYRVLWQDGEVRWVSERRQVFYDASGTQVIRVLLVAVDITERRKADQRKDEFLATLAHELRNPLAPVRTGLQVLEQPAIDSASAARIRGIMGRQVTQLVHLIDDLLDVSRISSGKVVLRRERLQLHSIVEAAIEACRPAIDAGRHDLQVEWLEEETWVYGDSARLAQVVSNLISNAAKYTPDQGRIAVRVHREGDDAVVSVTDNGVGIPPDMLNHVFEMFAQVNQTLDRAQGGLGIGLSIVRSLMDLHGGVVTAQSQGLGRGSTFTIRMPALSAMLHTANAGGAEPIRQHVRPLRILVIDDNRDGADSLALLLQLDGHQTRVEYDAAAGLNALKEFAATAIFCDIGLPSMDGYEFARRMRRMVRGSKPVLIAVTGWGSQEDKNRARAAGYDFHLTKPVDAEAVRRLLSRSLGQSTD